MMTRPVMGNKSSPGLTLSLLLMAALYLGPFIIEGIVYSSVEHMSWTEARLFCQKYQGDLVTWNQVDRFELAEQLMKIGARHVWIGLLRDPENSSTWKWIKTGEGVSGDDVSQSNNRSTEQQSNYCAAVSDKDQMWYSFRCSSGNYFYCSAGDNITYYKEFLSWYNASEYCHDKNEDLATINQNNVGYFKKSGWIGLYQDAAQWSWIGDTPSNYRNWAPGEPKKADCGFFDSVIENWYSQECSSKLRPACYNEAVVVVKENKTWEGALSHCSNMETPCVDPMGLCEYRHRLLHIGQLSDKNYFRDIIYRATTDEVWMGLRFLGGEWWWLNGQRPEDQHVLPDCPAQEKHCGSLSKYDTNQWITRDCSERRNFICVKNKIITAVWKTNVTGKHDD